MIQREMENLEGDVENIDRQHMDVAATDMAVNIVAGLFGEVKREAPRSRSSRTERAENNPDPVSL